MTRASALAGLLGLLLLPALAHAQSQPVFQINPAIPGDIPKIRANGQLEDAGGLLGDAGGGRGVNPFSILDNGGLGLSLNTARSGAAYNALRIGHDGVDGLISVNAYGGAAAGGLKCQINDGAKFDCFLGSRPRRTISSGLTDTATVTAATAAVADFRIFWNSAAVGGKTQNIPGCVAAIDSRELGIVDAAKTASIYNITVVPASGTINDVASLSLVNSGSTMGIQCDASTSNWVVVQ